MDKEKLIEALKQKGLANSLISLYYNIGRALPFRAQRFPDGRVSNWYESQFVEVHTVKPGGKGGKYGDAFGFYYRNGVRTDEYWCKAADVEPQKIPNAACGSWVLLDILGEPTVDPIKILSLDDILNIGKYQGKSVREIVHADWNWIKWAIQSSQHLYFDIDEIIKERKNDIKVLHSTDIMPFGKYKGITIEEISKENPGYLRWVQENSEDYVIDFGS